MNRKILLVSLAALFMVPAFTTLYFDSFEWAFENTEIPLSVGAESVWAANDSDVWAVAPAGFVSHFDGNRWSASRPVTESLYGVWGFASDNVVAVGIDGIVIAWNGANWQPMSSNTSEVLIDVW
ncbi:MAG: hypothetical protein JRD92_16195, partial [Deltaproteobacteria bacterium]|nr:hypothetical protein [Deltaproteobacteria bacterium]